MVLPQAMAAVTDIRQELRTRTEGKAKLVLNRKAWTLKATSTLASTMTKAKRRRDDRLDHGAVAGIRAEEAVAVNRGTGIAGVEAEIADGRLDHLNADHAQQIVEDGQDHGQIQLRDDAGGIERLFRSVSAVRSSRMTRVQTGKLQSLKAYRWRKS